MYQAVMRMVLATLVLTVLGASCGAADERTDARANSGPAVERARELVRMLDDLYKTNIVLITQNYVEDENSYPAGSAAIELFGAMRQKGWHDIRLVDVTGQPVNGENSPQDAFEREAILHLKKPGEAYFERIETRDGERAFRAATPVPVVLEKCVLCHDHYGDAKPGEPIGIISYSLPLK